MSSFISFTAKLDFHVYVVQYFEFSDYKMNN